MFTIEQSWEMSEPEKVLAIIKEIKVWRLANHDGCTCGHFKLRNVNVDIACGKGTPRAIRVYSVSGDYDNDHDGLLRPIAEEVKQQIEKSDHRGPIPIYFKEWKRDDD